MTSSTQARASMASAESVTARTWEYLIVALPAFQPAAPTPGQSDAVRALNREGNQGWEAVGMTALGDGHVAVLMKREAGNER